jgi:hypothetical protein
MPRALPTAQLALSGTLKDHPARYADRKNEPTPTGPLGYAPDYFDDARRKVWNELKTQIFPGSTGSSDRVAFEMLCELVVSMRAGTATDLESNRLLKLLGCFGMTPVDRSKIQVIPKKAPAASPFATFSAPLKIGTNG